jgi:hypothetical protein
MRYILRQCLPAPAANPKQFVSEPDQQWLSGLKMFCKYNALFAVPKSRLKASWICFTTKAQHRRQYQ